MVGAVPPRSHVAPHVIEPHLQEPLSTVFALTVGDVPFVVATTPANRFVRELPLGAHHADLEPVYINRERQFLVIEGCIVCHDLRPCG